MRSRFYFIFGAYLRKSNYPLEKWRKEERGRTRAKKKVKKEDNTINTRKSMVLSIDLPPISIFIPGLKLIKFNGNCNLYY